MPSWMDQSMETARSSASGSGSTPLSFRCPGVSPRLPRLPLPTSGLASAWKRAVRAGVISQLALACPSLTAPTRPSARCARTFPVGLETEPPTSPLTNSVPAMVGSGGGGGGGIPDDAEAADVMWWINGANRCAGKSMTPNAASCTLPSRLPSTLTTAPSDRSSRRRRCRPSTASMFPCACTDCTWYGPHCQPLPSQQGHR